MAALGEEFARQVYDITARIVEYPDAGGKRRHQLDAEIPRALGELDQFVSRPDVEQDIEGYLQFRRDHARPDGTPVPLSEMRTGLDRQFLRIEKVGRFAGMKKAQFEGLLERFFQLNRRQKTRVTGLKAEVLIKFLLQGLTEAYVRARDARKKGKQDKKQEMKQATDIATLLGFGASLARYNPLWLRRPLTIDDVIKSIELGMAGVHETADRLFRSSEVAKAVKDAVSVPV
jgi:hypothetical protein